MTTKAELKARVRDLEAHVKSLTGLNDEAYSLLDAETERVGRLLAICNDLEYQLDGEKLAVVRLKAALATAVDLRLSMNRTVHTRKTLDTPTTTKTTTTWSHPDGSAVFVQGC